MPCKEERGERMFPALDLAAVLRFVNGLDARVRECDNGEGTICSSLELRIKYYDDLCRDLHAGICEWAEAVFSGRVAFEQTIEDVFLAQAQRVLHKAKEVAAQGRAMEVHCFELEPLERLQYRILDLDFLLHRWVTPRRAAGPAARVAVPEDAKRQMRERLAKLPPLPIDWYPSYPDQIEFFERLRGK